MWSGLPLDRRRSCSRRSVTKSAGIKPSDLARALTRRGWEVSTGDVFNWQTRGSQEVSPALIQAIAEITGSTTGSLTVDLGASPESSELRAVTETPRFKELVVRWAQLRRTSPDLATSALTARLATSVHGGQRRRSDAELVGSIGGRARGGRTRCEQPLTRCLSWLKRSRRRPSGASSCPQLEGSGSVPPIRRLDHWRRWDQRTTGSDGSAM
jgi:hypothetical protein